MYETPIVVIIAAVPRTARIGRSAIRSTATPSKPARTIVTAKAKTSAPTKANPVRTRLTRQPEQLERPHADERADHEHAEMREVDQLENAVDEREAERQQ